MIKNILIVCILILIIYKITNKPSENFNNSISYIDSVKIRRSIPIYGDDQFKVKNLDFDKDMIFKFQDTKLISKNKDLELTDKVIKKYNPTFKIKKNIDIDSKIYKGIYKKTNLPSQEDKTYDFNDQVLYMIMKLKVNWNKQIIIIKILKMYLILY
jgi:hypothetical protein